MDFFAHQDEARRRTTLLLALFAVAVLVLVAATNLAVAVGLSTVHDFIVRVAQVEGRAPYRFWDPLRIVVVSIATLGFIVAASAWRLATLRRGGAAVAELLGGRLVPSDAADPALVRLRNVVEEMAIAAGVPAPDLYVLPREPEVNAFVAGWSADAAALAVTQGALDTLTRDELQGVVAHELSHVLHGDMALNLRLVSVLHGILLVAVVGRVLLGAGRRPRRGRSAGGLAIAGLLLVVLGWAGLLCARVIKAAISRQREFLADAGAVQFTRNPAGLAAALARIGRIGPLGSALVAPRAEELSHFFFADGVAGLLAWRLLATHPPIAERVRRLVPGFDGDYDGLAARLGVDLAPPSAGVAPHLEQYGPVVVEPEAVPRLVGAPSEEGLRYGREVLSGLPPAVREAARNPLSARNLLVALALSASPPLRARQLALVRERFGESAERWVAWCQGEVAARGRVARLPLLELAAPALRRLSRAQGDALAGVLLALTASHERLDLFGVVVQRFARRMLPARGADAPRHPRPTRSLGDVRVELSLLVSAVAAAGAAGDPSVAHVAFDAADRATGVAGLLRPAVVDPLPVEELHRALDRLAASPPRVKRRVLAICAAAALSDRTVTVDEAELLRAVAETLGCPLPPLPGPR